MAEMDFGNATQLDGERLRAMCENALHGWAVGRLRVRFRYSRGADFSGTCFYGSKRIFVNIGRHLAYPYRMNTHVGRAKTVGRRWYKPQCVVRLTDGHQLAMFIFMHELYHMLVKRARRNTRQKESMCDRFATRYVVVHFGLCVETARGKPIPRGEWDFQDLDAFVAAARDRRITRPRAAARRPIAVSVADDQPLTTADGTPSTQPIDCEAHPTPTANGQLLLFALR